MKINDYTFMETTLNNVFELLEVAYEQVDTSEDANWSKDLEKAFQLIDELRQSMIYCFKIEEK